MFVFATLLALTGLTVKSPSAPVALAGSAVHKRARQTFAPFVLLAPNDTYTPAGGSPTQNLTAAYELFNTVSDGDTVTGAPPPGSGSIPPPSFVTFPDGHAAIVLKSTSVTINLSTNPQGVTIANTGGTVSAISPVWNNSNAALKVVVKTRRVSTAANGCLLTVNYVPSGASAGSCIYQYEGGSTLTLLTGGSPTEQLGTLSSSNPIADTATTFPTPKICAAADNLRRRLAALSRSNRSLRAEIRRLEHRLHEHRWARRSR